MKQYTREELIGLCEQALVPIEKWADRDSPQSQEKLAVAHHMLKAGCRFHVTYSGDKDDRCVTDDDTIWLYLMWPSFATFEHDGADEELHVYLPTQKRLDERKGRDWY